MRWFRDLGARLRLLFGRGAAERPMEEMRDGRGLAWLSGLLLDLKLGVRQLVRYPVLTAASALALAAAVALAAAWFEFAHDFARPRIPLDEADRIVTIRNRDLSAADRDFNSEPRALHDFEAWRAEARSIEDLTAISLIEYTAITEDGRFATLRGARVTPSMFRLVRVAPLLGRPLTADDDRPGAPLVAVLGHDAWQRLFGGDRAAIGRAIRLGSEYATVVGVMPAGFGFPLNQEVWTPLQDSAARYARRAGPAIRVVGRLADGVTLEQAQAELAMIGQRAAAQFPETHEHLRPEVTRFARGGGWEARIIAALNIPFLLFLVVVSANLAALLFARTVARESEIALRSALGASRRRIIIQLVAESLVLTSLAAALGLAAARWGLRRGMGLFFEVQQMRPPFWFDFGLSASTVVYTAALAVLGAAIIGGIPGLRATGRALRHRLSQPGAGGSGMRFGTFATGVIVAQVGLCVAFFPVAIMRAQDLMADREVMEFPAEAYLTGRVLYQPATAGSSGNAQVARPEDGQRVAQLLDEVHRRLAAQPGVLAATRASRLPGFNHPVTELEIEGDSARIVGARLVAVDPDFFEVMGARITGGRAFRPDDPASEARVAIVDEAWARDAFGGRSAIGQRFRLVDADEHEADWYEIVGVVDGMKAAIGPGTPVGVYVPLRSAQHGSVQFYLRAAGEPEALVPQVHALVTSVDARLGIADVAPLDEIWRPVQRSDAYFTAALAVVGAILLLFALIGIYALMSFTVAQRTREIGIRVALGADPKRLILSTFARGSTQIGLGIALGAALVSLTVARSAEGLRLVGGVAAGMVIVGLAGCVVPALRALRIQPAEALRVE
ncbi:MAG TPA: ABC transporter permease [Longimicrobiales bacterium]